MNAYRACSIHTKGRCLMRGEVLKILQSGWTVKPVCCEAKTANGTRQKTQKPNG